MISNPKSFSELGKEIGMLVGNKNDQYGDSFNKIGEILEILYPNGLEKDDYTELAGVVRVLDKLSRIAEGDKGDESAWRDIAGYGLLGEMRKLRKEEMVKRMEEGYAEQKLGTGQVDTD